MKFIFFPALLSAVWLLVSSQASAASPDQLIKLACPARAGADHPCRSVYYMGVDGKRYVFPTESVYKSWYTDFRGVAEVSAQEMGDIPIGGNVFAKPGQLIKVQTDKRVYAVSAGGVLREVKSESVARTIWGKDWNKQVTDMPEAFFVNYMIGDPISTGSEYSLPDERGRARSISEDRELPRRILGGGVPNVGRIGEALTTKTLPSRAGAVEFGAYEVRNPTSAPLDVQAIALERIGVSADTALERVGIIADGVMVGTPSAVNNSQALVNTVGELVIPAQSARVIRVVADTGVGGAGQTVGIRLKSVVVGGGITLAGLPLDGALFTVSSLALGDVTWSNPAQEVKEVKRGGQIAWKAQVDVASSQVRLDTIVLDVNQFPALSDSELASQVVFYIDRVAYKTSIKRVENRLVLDAEGTGALLKSGSHILHLEYVPCATGTCASANVSLVLDSGLDVALYDDAQNVRVASRGNFPIRGVTTVKDYAVVDTTLGGTSPTGKIRAGRVDATLARFSVSVTKQPVKLESITAGFVTSRGDVSSLANARVMIGGVQVGSVKSLMSAGAGGTVFNFGAVELAKDKVHTIEIRADVPMSLAKGDTLTVSLLAGSSNALQVPEPRVGYAVPTAPIVANPLTVE